MILGASYNIFDGEELLEGSIKSIRDKVDYVSVVYQNISNFNNNASENLDMVLKKLKDEKLIDELLLYTPKLNLPPHINEINKRNLGLELSKKVNCTHHISMDSDEYYSEKEFSFLKDDIINNGYDSTFSKMLTYYKTNEYILDPPEEYYVSLIYKIRKNIDYQYGLNIPIVLDPTRRMMLGKYKLYNRDEIQMHHLSMVRNNIESKFLNSTANVLYYNNIPKLIDEYNKWVYPNKVLWPGNPPFYTNVKKIKPLI